MPVAVGETFERYEIESLIGRGGMGEVYRATDTRLRRKVALKVLRPDRDSTDAVARLFREARSAAVLTHPNTVAIHDIGEAEGTFYIVMELVTGVPLRDSIGDARVPLARKLAWLADVARALAAAHRAGVIHRDVKPSNVMVSDDGVVKVLDFGLARPTAPLSFRTQAGHVLGTPKYMAPEQLAGAEVDARTDQYSFGLTAYELLAGAHPGGAIAGLLEPPPLDSVAPGISRAVALVVARAMATEPEARYASMEDVVVALEDAAAGRRTREEGERGEPSAAVEREELTLASPGASPERVASTVRFGSPAAGSPGAASLTATARRPPDTAATPTASSPPPGNTGLRATVPLGAAATLAAAALQRTADSTPPTLEAAARPLQQTAPLAMDAASVEQARAQLRAAMPPAVKTLLTAGEVPPPPKTAPVLGRPGESVSLIAAPRPKAASPSVPPVRGDASPSPTRPPSSTRRSSSNGIRVAMVVIAIVVLGLCAFAGAYYGSRAFAVRPAATPPPATTGALAAPPGTTSPAAATHAASAPHAATEIAAPSGPAPAASPRPAPTPTPTPTPRPAPTPAPATTTTRPAASNLDARF